MSQPQPLPSAGHPATAAPAAKLRFATPGGFILRYPGDIVYITAARNKSQLHCTGGKVLSVSGSIGQVEKLLPQREFLRIGRSCIINLAYLERVDCKALTCNLLNGKEMTDEIVVGKAAMNRIIRLFGK